MDFSWRPFVHRIVSETTDDSDSRRAATGDAVPDHREVELANGILKPDARGFWSPRSASHRIRFPENGDHRNYRSTAAMDYVGYRGRYHEEFFQSPAIQRGRRTHEGVAGAAAQARY